MKIRSQFYILTAGIVLVPIAVFIGMYALQRSRESVAVKVPGYEEISRRVSATVNRESWEDLAVFMSHKPSTIEFTVFDGQRRVVFSTMADQAIGETIGDEALLAVIRQTSGRYLYQLDSPVPAGNGGLLVLTRILRDREKLFDPFRDFVATLAVLLGALFVFSASMSILIARSITESVMALDAATARIASGELDLEIRAEGSNEISSLSHSLNSMRLALKDDQARRSRFIMGVTHDLKTPLSLIKGYAEAIGDGLADDPRSRARYVGIIGSKVDQLSGMIDDLIDFVRVDTGEWRRRLEPVPLAPFLKGLAKRMDADAALLGRRVQSAVDLPDGLVVPLDERLVTRALENVVNNALRYTGDGGLIGISARAEPGRAVVEISDDGPGIDEADIQHIFDTFYRGSASRREQGMGLGLSIVKSVVESHGWTIGVVSSRGAGCVFSIAIPIA